MKNNTMNIYILI